MYCPGIAGFAVVWCDAFTRFTTISGTGPYEQWNVIQGPGLNTIEKQYYNSSSDLTYVMSYAPSTHDPTGQAKDQLFITPQKTGNQWRSARLEGKTAHGCPDGKQMILEASLRVGTASSDKQAGVWPAFWALGKSQREGTVWPLCGEWDIMETSDGHDWSQGTAHYGLMNNGAPEVHSLTSKKKNQFSHGDYHTWTFKVDRRSSNWQEQTLQWFMDNKQFEEVKGSSVPTQAIWETLTKQAYFPILNIAIGSQFPESAGLPNDKTSTGLDVGMVVDYVGFYEST